MERTVAVSECERGSLHINPEYGVLELTDEQPGPGAAENSARRQVTRARVLGTSLHNRSMPLLRYEVGDVVEVDRSAGPCACGRGMPRIQRVLGRQEDVVIAPNGRAIPTLFIVFNEVPGVSLGQIVQEDPDWLRVRVVRGIEYTADSEALLQQLVRRFVGPEMRIVVEYPLPEALRRESPGKFRTVISRVRPMAAAEPEERVGGTP
jgi:phenylacetate-CoA ligase